MALRAVARYVGVGPGVGPQGPPGPQGNPGPTGPQGPPGATGMGGLMGPVGPQGPEGPPGPIAPAGLTWQGEWQAGTAYTFNDVVNYGTPPASYWALQAVPSDTPPSGDGTSTAYWAYLASAGPAGPEGPAGPQGQQGIQGNAGLQGPMGLQGPVGATGATGPQGNPGDFPDAPNDGSIYGRQNLAWAKVPDVGGAIPEAPADGQLYGRNGALTTWQTAVPTAGGIITGTLQVGASSTTTPAPLVVGGQGITYLSLGAIGQNIAWGVSGGLLYLFQNGLNVGGAIATQSWVTSGFLGLAGGILTGPVTLSGDATNPLNPVSLQQMQAEVTNLMGDFLPLVGGTLAGPGNLTVNGLFNVGTTAPYLAQVTAKGNLMMGVAEPAAIAGNPSVRAPNLLSTFMLSGCYPTGSGYANWGGGSATSLSLQGNAVFSYAPPGADGSAITAWQALGTFTAKGNLLVGLGPASEPGNVAAANATQGGWVNGWISTSYNYAFHAYYNGTNWARLNQYAPAIFSTDNSGTFTFISAPAGAVGSIVPLTQILAVGPTQINGFVPIVSSAPGGTFALNDTNAQFMVNAPSGVAALAFARTGVVATKIGVNASNVFTIGGWSWNPDRMTVDSGGNVNAAANITGVNLTATTGNVAAGNAVYVNFPTVPDFYLNRGSGNRYLQYAGNWYWAWNESTGALTWHTYGGATVTIDGNANVVATAFFGTSLNGGANNAGVLNCWGNTGSVCFRWTGNALTFRVNEAIDWSICTQTNAQNFAYGANASAPAGVALNGYDLAGTLYAAYIDQISDARIKDNVAPSEIDALARIMAIPVRQFDIQAAAVGWLGSTGLSEEERRAAMAEAQPWHSDIGFVAQELGDVVPEAITVAPATLPPGLRRSDANPLPVDVQSISLPRLVPYLLRGEQQLYGLIEQLSAEVRSLKERTH